MPHPVLSKAPIVEAFLDIRVAPDLPDLGVISAFQVAVKPALKAEFPRRNEVIEWSGRLELSPPAGPQFSPPSQVVRGFSYASSDGQRVLQARTNGFSLSHLTPYRSWEALKSEAQGWWARYAEQTRPTMVTRIGLRFINRLQLPVGVDMREFLQSSAELAPELPQTVMSYFLKLAVPFGPNICVVTQFIEPEGVTADQVPLIFDIDVYRDVRWLADSADIWSAFDELRDVKNQVFFKSLTPAAVEMYT